MSRVNFKFCPECGSLLERLISKGSWEQWLRCKKVKECGTRIVVHLGDMGSGDAYIIDRQPFKVETVMRFKKQLIKRY